MPVIGAALALAALAALAAAPAEAPHLRRAGTATQLVVDGAPFLVLGGELGNSTGEPAYLKTYWPKLRELGLNTVLAPVYWDQLEPQPGRFDFAQVDGLLAAARAQRMRLVLLWFGSWKNSMSCYAPAWVKSDPQRFPRAQDSSGRGLEILSPFADANRDADARAFAALMRHLKAADGRDHTVVMVQVENEIGMIPEPRDRSAAADAQFAGPVPAELVGYLADHAESLAPEVQALWSARGRPRSGTWEDVFGPGPATAEVFMAWHFGRYVQAVTAAGKAEYALPMFVNAALVRPGYEPGQYPSAGPLPHLLDVWRAAAPAVDFLAPDVYFPNFAEWARRYARGGNPLFVPEALRSPDAAVNALYAFGAHDAIGFAPFGIESTGEPASSLLAGAYAAVASLAPQLTAAQGQGRSAGLLPPAPENQREPQRLRLNGYVLDVVYERQPLPSLADGVPAGGAAPAPAPMPAGGLVLATGPDEFVFAGVGFRVTFAPDTPGEPIAGLLSVEELAARGGRLEHVRFLNGDQTHQGRHVRLEMGRIGIQRVKLYRYR
ncbi:MAG: DUF5597 domain-containing protein [Vicinamibacteria bacterium]